MAATKAVNTYENEISNGIGIPGKYEGYILKKKKWPMKGWHRRYFFLESGFLKYAKSPHAISKNKLHGLMDMGLSVMSTKKNALTIDLDAEDTIFHLKLKTNALYQLWLSKLRLHRDFRLLELKKDSTFTHHNNAGSEPVSSPTLSPTSKEKEFVLDEEVMLNSCQRSLMQAEQQIKSLEQMVSDLHETSNNVVSAILLAPFPSSPSLLKRDKERKSKKLSKKTKNSINSIPSCESVYSLPVEGSAITPNLLTTDGFQFKIPEPLSDNLNLSKSNPDLSLVTPPVKSPPPEDSWPKNSSQISKSVQSTPIHGKAYRASTVSESSSASNPLSNILNNFTEKQRRFVSSASAIQKSLALLLGDLKQAEESKQNQAKLVALNNSLAVLSNENNDLRSRLQRIHNESSLGDPVPGAQPQSHLVKRRLTSKTLLSQFLSESQLSISESVSDLFYDAEEYLLSDEGSTTSDEGSETVDDELSSDDESETASSPSLPFDVEEIGARTSGFRRARLPCNRPDTDVSLWNILKKNIGKDLSKVAMPVTLNEPLNALQLLCEELEYSNLLDRADACDDIYEQMVYVAAFAITGYSSTYTRAGQKPFNPILGETYECVREDKQDHHYRSFRFVSEQVSHHPPISACHCEGERFEFWQDARFKNKFWGKSMEIFPVGSVHVRLKRHDRHFQWKKVTSCVHNVMAGTRWIEHYGDMHISCDADVSCKVVFSKSGYWSGKNGEVSGAVVDVDGKVRCRVQGKWFESLTCDVGGRTNSIWKPNPMPVDYEKQYGFTCFAIELNEIRTDDVEFLPRTDTRFRPDQRCLENGDISGAEAQKARVEQLQREHKKKRDSEGAKYKPLFFTKINDQSDDGGWTFKQDYWKLRQDPGFNSVDKIPVLW